MEDSVLKKSFKTWWTGDVLNKRSENNYNG